MQGHRIVSKLGHYHLGMGNLGNYLTWLGILAGLLVVIRDIEI